MGYYDEQDIPIHRALADAFTICDNYHCSVIGPTDPNRMYWMTGTLDPDGFKGGPVLRTQFPVPKHSLSWKTYPECLQEAGVSWKIYQDKTFGGISEMIFGGMMDWFKAYDGSTAASKVLASLGIDPTYPDDFRSDVENGRLPKVSWIVPNLLTCEHPALPSALGAWGMLQVLDILTKDPALWAKTALIISYDENGGFFDHVPPLTPPAGTAGEFVTRPPADPPDGLTSEQPVGLGFRVPCLVVSPYSRGGLVAKQRFDHTSQLRMLETRFGVRIPDHSDGVPGLSVWRRENVEDLTLAFDFGEAPDDAPPNLPHPHSWEVWWDAFREAGEIILDEIHLGRSYPVPDNSKPEQATEPKRRSPTPAAQEPPDSTDGASGLL
jgi:phospholipase C